MEAFEALAAEGSREALHGGILIGVDAAEDFSLPLDGGGALVEAGETEVENVAGKTEVGTDGGGGHTHGVVEKTNEMGGDQTSGGALNDDGGPPGVESAGGVVRVTESGFEFGASEQTFTVGDQVAKRVRGFAASLQ
jgi:hypothetical protein